MMNKTFWEEIASLWVLVQSEEDQQAIEQTASCIVDSAIKERHKEKDFLDELMSGINEEYDDDDDGY